MADEVVHEGNNPLERASLDDIDRAPISLPSDISSDPATELAQLRQRFNEVVADKDRLQQDFEDLKKNKSTIAELDKLIGPSAKSAFRYMTAYSTGTFVLLICDGAKWGGFDLNESVLDLLVGSTAVTVLGLVGMVLTGIFVGARKATRGEI